MRAFNTAVATVTNAVTRGAFGGHASLNTSLEGYYAFDSDATDSTGTQNGTVSGATYGSSSGVISGGYSFDGDVNYIEIGRGTWAQTAASFSLWVKNNNADASVSVYMFSRNEGGDNAGDFSFIWWTNEKYNFYSQDGVGGDLDVDISADDAVTDTNWHHVVVTYDATSTIMYVDGSAQADVGAGIDIAAHANSYKMGIGQINGGDATVSGAGWDGFIDEVGIWNKKLSAQEVTDLYNSGSGLTY